MAKRSLEIVITGDSRGASRAFRGVDRDATRLTGRMQNTGRVIARTFAAFGAAYTAQAAIRAVGDETIQFDKGMRNVNSIAQLSEKQLNSLSQSVLDLAGPTAQSPVKLSEGLYDLVSSGFNAAESLKILRSSANAATAGLTTTEISTKTVAAVLNAYQQPARKASDVSDVLFRTVDRGVISFEELASTVGDVLPFASSLDIGLRGVGASVATMTKAGISAPEAMTRIKNVMVTMLKPGEDLGKAIKSLGFESGEALIHQKGFQGSLEALTGTTDGSKEAIAALFPNIRALGGVLALTGKNTQAAEQDLRGMKDAAGATSRALSQQSKSVSFQWNRLKASAEVLAIEMGSKLVPAANEVLEVLSDDRLTNDQKLGKLADLIGKQIETVAREAPKILADATPKIVGAGVILGKGLGEGVITGFAETDLLGKLLLGAGAIRLFGGPGALTKVGASIGNPMGVGAVSSFMGSFTELRAASVLSGGGITGMGKALGWQLGPQVSKFMASGMVRAIPGAIAAIGLADTAASAMSGDWESAGFKAGGALIGGVAGAFLGPQGALIGAGLGSMVGGLAEDLFSSGEKIKSLQDLIADGSRAVAQGVHAETAAAGQLRGSSRRIVRAQDQQEAATRRVKQAEENLIAARRQYGPGTAPAIRAEGRLQQAKAASARATKRARDAQKLQGEVLKAARGVYRSNAAEEKVLIDRLKARRQELLKQLAVQNRVNPGGKRQAEIFRALGKNAGALNRTQGNLNKTLLRAAQQVGPGFAKSLREMSTLAAGGQKYLGQLAKPIKPLRRSVLDLDGTFSQFSRGTSDQLDRVARSADKFADASGTMRRRTNSNIRALVPVHDAAIDGLLEDFTRGKSAIDGSSRPAIAKRGGGGLRRGSGTVPVKLSPGERVDVGKKSYIVPGRPQPRDSVYAELPEEAVVWTWDGQTRLARGESPQSVLQTQAPHFREGGLVKPSIVGGSSGSRSVANKSLGTLTELGDKELARLERMMSMVGAGKHRNYPMLSGDTDFVPALGWALSKMARKTGRSINVASGWRSYSEQAALYAAYLAGTGNLAAPPGSSNHEDGRAADISPGSEVFGGVAGQYGLGFTVPGESWHIELLRRGGKVRGFRDGGQVGLVVKGRATWFNGGATAGGSNTSRPGVSLNPGTWNSPLTRFWRDSSLDGNPYYARVAVGGKSAILPITDMGPADWTGNSIDVTEGGLRKMGYTTGDFPSGTIGTARILGTKKDRSKAIGQAEARLGGVENLWDRIKEKGTTKAGRRRAVNATKTAKQALKAARHFNVDAAERYISRSKRQQALAYKGIARRQAQKRRREARRERQQKNGRDGSRGGGGWGGSGGGKHRDWDPTKPFSVNNSPGTNRLPSGINALLGMDDLSWDSRRGILDTALARAESTDTKVDDAAALRAIVGMESRRRNRSLRMARRLAGQIKTAGGKKEAERLLRAARKQGDKAGDLEKRLDKELDRKKVDKAEVKEIRASLRKRRAAQRKAAAEAKRIQRMIDAREQALGRVGSSTSEINSATQGIKDLNESSTDNSTTDTAVSDLAEEMKALREAILEQNKLQSSVEAVSMREATRVMADMLSGQLVGKGLASAPSYPTMRH